MLLSQLYIPIAEILIPANLCKSAREGSDVEIAWKYERVRHFSLMANRLTVIFPAILCICAFQEGQDTQPVNTGSRYLREEKSCLPFHVNILNMRKKTFTGLLFPPGSITAVASTKQIY
jgi:hypothetical protein